MVLLSHPTGNVNVRQAALALAESDWLAEFWTCLHWNPDSPAGRWLPARVRELLERRILPPAVRERTRINPWLEAARLASSKFGLAALARHEQGLFSVDAVYRRFDARVARRIRTESTDGLRAVYAYEDGAADTFAAARERGLTCLYDLPIGYWRTAQEIYREEAEREPRWAATIEGARDSEEKLARKEREIAGADLVIVASQFTARTLAGAGDIKARVEIIPYGAPPVLDAPRGPSPPGRLRALFVGALTQRKGLSYALEATQRCGPHVELTLIGARPTAPCAALDDALRRHRWIPDLSPAQVLGEMRRHDVLLFPSLCEGFGLVILEALSCGLPVIATPNTGAPDVLTDGVEGFIVPIRSVDAIAEKLERLIRFPSQVLAMKEAAEVRARTLTWEGYRASIARVVISEIDRRAAAPTSAISP